MQRRSISSSRRRQRLSGMTLTHASLEIGLLVSKREDLMRLIASKDARAYVLAADADDIKAARDRVLERSVRHTTLMLEMN